MTRFIFIFLKFSVAEESEKNMYNKIKCNYKSVIALYYYSTIQKSIQQYI